MSKTPDTRVVARIISTDPGTNPSRRPAPKRSLAHRLARKVSTLAIGIIVVFLATMGTGGFATANAIPGIPDPVEGITNAMKDLFCFGTIEDGPSPQSSNSDEALIGARSPYGDSSLEGKSVTAYEEYGTSGLFWSEYRPKNKDDNADKNAGCVTNKFGPFIGNMMANNIFSVSGTFTSATIGMYKWASSGDLLDNFTAPLDCVIEGCNGGRGLKTSLFLNYLAPVVMMGALWGAWNGLIKKKTTETAQGGLWMLGATAFALVFLAQPTAVADKSNDFVNEVSTTIMNGVTSATSTNINNQDMCFLKHGSSDRGNRMAACSMYKAMLVTPWAAGQFGVPLGVKLEGDKTVRIGDKESNDLRLVQIEAQTMSQTELNSGSSEEEISSLDGIRWMSVKENVDEGIGANGNDASFIIWSGDAPATRVNIALSSVLASAFLGILVIVLSFSTVVMAISMILLIMMAPLFLLVGIHPGFGRGIALKWLELLIGTVLKRIVLSAILAILVGMYQVILETPMPWFSQIALIMALGVGAIIFRKPLLETLNVVNLGGSSTGMDQGLGQQGKKGAAAATGAGTGAIAAGVAGGGVAGMITGGFKGGVSGSRSGSPVRAATMASATGRRVGTMKRTAELRAMKEERQKLVDRLEQDPDDRKTLADVAKFNKNVKPGVDKIPVPRPQGGTGGGGGPAPDLNVDKCAQCTHPAHASIPCPQCGCAGPSGPGGGGAGPRPGGAGPRPGGMPTQPPTPGPAPTGGAPLPTEPPTTNTPPPRPDSEPTPEDTTTPPVGGTPRPGGTPPTGGTPPSAGTPPNGGTAPSGGTGNPPRPQGR